MLPRSSVQDPGSNHQSVFPVSRSSTKGKIHPFPRSRLTPLRFVRRPAPSPSQHPRLHPRAAVTSPRPRAAVARSLAPDLTDSDVAVVDGDAESAALAATAIPVTAPTPVQVRTHRSAPSSLPRISSAASVSNSLSILVTYGSNHFW